MDEMALRKTLTELLRGGQAHISLDRAVSGLSPGLRARRPAGLAHSVWELIEHIRIAQEDILRYTLDASWTSPPWPEGYWPENPAALSDSAWNESIAKFQTDLEEVVGLVEDQDLDLTRPIPHGEWRTYLRQVLLIADHNGYHLGQIVDVRRALDAWPV